MTVFNWFIRVNVEYENSEHNCGSKVFPAEKPKFVGFVSSHLLNTITKSGKNKKHVKRGYFKFSPSLFVKGGLQKNKRVNLGTLALKGGRGQKKISFFP